MCFKLIIFTVICFETHNWQHYSLCSANQYFILNKNGAYQYGYETNDGIVARQEADNKNQVSGHYFYGDNTNLRNFGTKYTSGVPGFMPEKIGPNELFYQEHPYPTGLQSQQIYRQTNPSPFLTSSTATSTSTQRKLTGNEFLVSGQLDEQFDGIEGYLSTPQTFRRPLDQGYFVYPQYGVNFLTPNYNRKQGVAYSFSFDTGNYKREESSDLIGNVRGYFQYQDDAGIHDLSYIANDKVGFQVTGGNLASISPGYLPVPPVDGRNKFSPNLYNTKVVSVSSAATNRPVTISSTTEGQSEKKKFSDSDDDDDDDDDDVPIVIGMTTEMEIGINGR